MRKLKSILHLIPRLIVAIILLQTLWFKFGIGGQDALEQSKLLFGTLTHELFGDSSYEIYFRIATGITELIASILVLYKPKSLYGALLASSIMLGALIAHVFFIGVSFQGDGGQLMILAIIVLFSSMKIIWDEQEQFEQILP